jgi:ketosteroid isomerase-like protein
MSLKHARAETPAPAGKLVAALAAALMLAACATPLPEGANLMTEPSPDARIRSRADYDAYLAAFNAHRYDDQIAYYAPDVEFSVGSITLSSPEAIKEFYDDFHDYVDEHVGVAAYAQTGDTVAVAVPTRFEARRTYDKNGLTFEPGEVREIVTLAFYKLKDGKIWRIRMARYNGTAADFAE